MCSITSFIDHAIQINVEQKDKEIQWRVVDLAEFLYTALLYQVMTNRNINAATLLEQYSVLVEKEQWGDFYTAGYCECVIRFRPRLISNN